MIYGAIGYSILKNSELFDNSRIILISDNHDEEFKDCGSSVPDIQIESYLEYLLNNNYVTMIEEIPNVRELVSLFPESSHVENTRKFYINNKDNKNLIPIDVRFELIDNHDEEYYDKQKLKDYISKISEFFLFKHKFFIGLSLYSERIYVSILKSHYKYLLEKYDLFKKKFDKFIEIEIKYIPYKKVLIYEINEILSDIMELYILIKIYDILNNGERKIIIYAGLYHIDKIKNLLINYYKYKEYEKYGSTNINDNENICIKFIPE